MNKIERLGQVYREGLTKAVNRTPDAYPWYPRTSVDDVVAKMIARVEQDGIGAVTIDHSPGFAYAAKHLGIKNTYREWKAWLRED